MKHTIDPNTPMWLQDPTGQHWKLEWDNEQQWPKLTLATEAEYYPVVEVKYPEEIAPPV
jgi:hypothetical protein